MTYKMQCNDAAEHSAPHHACIVLASRLARPWRRRLPLWSAASAMATASVFSCACTDDTSGFRVQGVRRQVRGRRHASPSMPMHMDAACSRQP